MSIRCCTYETLETGVFPVSVAEQMLSRAIAQTLQADPEGRADLFEKLTKEIVEFVSNANGEIRPWTCAIHTGTDGSRIFRGGIGHSLVIDPQGRMWRARTYEDFETTYTITPTSCEIATMKPIYSQMREYLPG
jgi:hypothetical protein